MYAERNNKKDLSRREDELKALQEIAKASKFAQEDEDGPKPLNEYGA